MKHFKQPIFISVLQPYLILIDENSPFLYQIQCDHLRCVQKQVRGYYYPLPFPSFQLPCFETASASDLKVFDVFFSMLIKTDLISFIELTEDMIVREAFVHVTLGFKEKPNVVYRGILSWNNCD